MKAEGWKLEVGRELAEITEKRKTLIATIRVLTLVRSTGLEPVRLPIRPSNVRVCQFHHDRITYLFYVSFAVRNSKIYYTGWSQPCQYVFLHFYKN